MTVLVKYIHQYDFVPSEGAAIAFAIIFFITMAAHGFQLFRTKTWFFIPFLIGLIFESAGYIARAYSSTQYPDYKIAPMLIQYILILVAPALLAASIYMEFGRIILVTNGENYTIIRRTWLTKIFVCGDIISFVVQFGGAGMLANTSTASSGPKIMEIGVVIQILFFGLFLITIIIFHVRLVKMGSATLYTVPWKRHVMASYASGALIFVRSVFRLVEFTEFTGSTEGPIAKYEWMSYVFDAVMILITSVIFNWVHPSEMIPYLPSERDSTDMEMLAETEEKDCI
ncbi:uncharacterized protein N7503_011151 [Penicillium pulvis]|uniref:uncharacterized protein n=1 Tax=Penicillium pulvis TaxID=1562058 RepID=UPI0025468858|nr:uncharacterized protein N7503_011151 [Penicillium pulvis]KAJ5785939.1 hypothetical protein N7503_011151 [Penicillium pulvis]